MERSNNATVISSKEPETQSKSGGQTAPPKNHTEIVVQEIERNINGFMRTVLTEFETLLPHQKEDGSLNETKFKNLRRNILRQGNDRVTHLRTYLKDFYTIKEYESKKILQIQFNVEKGKA